MEEASEIVSVVPECQCRYLYDCCDCGGNQCGCRGCFSCNACDQCTLEVAESS